jgi:hypothetical protein
MVRIRLSPAASRVRTRYSWIMAGGRRAESTDARRLPAVRRQSAVLTGHGSTARDASGQSVPDHDPMHDNRRHSVRGR